MAEARIDYRPRGRTGFDCTLMTESGSWLTVSGLVGDLSPATDGSDTLRANRALVNSLWACGIHDAEYRRLRADEKRKSHAKQRDRHAAEAQVIAKVYSVEKVSATVCLAHLNEPTVQFYLESRLCPLELSDVLMSGITLPVKAADQSCSLSAGDMINSILVQDESGQILID